MKELTKIQKVEDFIICNKSAVVKKGGHKIETFNFNFSESSSLDLYETIQELHCEEQVLYTNTSFDGKGILINGINTVKKNFYIRKILAGGDIIGTTNEMTFRISNDDNKVLWEVNKTIYQMYQTTKVIVYLENMTGLEILSLANGASKCRFKISQDYSWINSWNEIVEPKIMKIIGLYNEILWIGLNSGHIIGLSTIDGKEKFYVTRPSIFPNHWDEKKVEENYVFGYDGYIDYAKGVMFSFIGSRYNELNLNLPGQGYEIFDVDEELMKTNIENNFFGDWNKNEIFFGQKEWGTDTYYVGIFNRETKKIVWTSRDFNELKGLKKIQLTPERLYVLDGEQTLHVIDREIDFVEV